MQSTINQMIEHFVPEDSEDAEEVHHKRVTQQESGRLQTTNDVEFTRHGYRQYWKSSTLVKRQEEKPCPVRYACTYLGASHLFHADLRVFKKRTLPETMEKFGDSTHR